MRTLPHYKYGCPATTYRHAPHRTKITIVAAVSEGNVIGKDGSLPWDMRGDIAHFRNLTLNGCVIMGQGTFDSIGKPLQERTNVIVTSRYGNNQTAYETDQYTTVFTVPSFVEALYVVDSWRIERAFVIGGQSIYEQALAYADEMILTQIYEEFAGDRFFPEVDASKWQTMAAEHHVADELNPYPYSRVKLARRAW